MKSIIVNVMPEETRIAVKENNRLTSLELERPRHSHLVGNIYKGIVQNVLPGMQAAFVDIGQSKNAFLYIGDGKAAVVLERPFILVRCCQCRLPRMRWAPRDLGLLCI